MILQYSPNGNYRCPPIAASPTKQRRPDQKLPSLKRPTRASHPNDPPQTSQRTTHHRHPHTPHPTTFSRAASARAACTGARGAVQRASLPHNSLVPKANAVTPTPKPPNPRNHRTFARSGAGRGVWGWGEVPLARCDAVTHQPTYPAAERPRDRDRGATGDPSSNIQNPPQPEPFSRCLYGESATGHALLKEHRTIYLATHPRTNSQTHVCAEA
jgi:hypothetical protein